MVRILFEKDLCLGCKTCELACATVKSKTKSITGAIQENKTPRLRINTKNGRLRLEQCMLCKNPICVKSCPTRALSRDEVSGTINVDSLACTSCGLCVESCPFGAIWLNNEVPSICDRCAGMDEPFCALSCPTSALKVKVI